MRSNVEGAVEFVQNRLDQFMVDEALTVDPFDLFQLLELDPDKDPNEFTKFAIRLELAPEALQKWYHHKISQL